MKKSGGYRAAYAEVLEVLKYISLEDYEKIPPKYIRLMEEQADENCLFKYNVAIPFDKQGISEEAKNILAMLIRLFVANEEQKERLCRADAVKMNKKKNDY